MKRSEVSDEAAAKLRQNRVIDEPGDDYLYPKDLLRRSVTSAGGGQSSTARCRRQRMTADEILSCDLIRFVSVRTRCLCG